MSNKSTEQMINDILNPDDRDWKEIAQWSGWAVYYLGILVAAAHIFSYNSAVLTGFYKIMGLAGSIGIVANSIVLPRAIKEWTVEALHRTTAILFYAIDIFLLAGMVWMNTNLVNGNTIQIVQDYQTWIAPLTFVNTILTWAFLFTLDPEARERYKIKRELTKAAMIKVRGQAAHDIIKAKQEAYRLIESAGPDPDYLPEPTRTAAYSGMDRPERRNDFPRADEYFESFDLDDPLIKDLPYQKPEPRNNHHPKV